MESSSERFDVRADRICGHMPYAILMEFSHQNGLIAASLFQNDGGPCHMKNFVATIVIRGAGGSFKVTGLPATTKKAAQHNAAVEVFNYLNLGRRWMVGCSQSSGHRKWRVSDDIFTRVYGTEWITPVGGIPAAADLINRPSMPDAAIPVAADSIQQPSTWDAGIPATTDAPGNGLTPFHLIVREACDKLIAARDVISIPSVNSTNSSLGVPQLREFCEQHNFSAPNIEDVAALGKSHCPTFIMECTVKEVQTGQSFTTRVTASTTKQQIKRMVSQKMMMKLSILLGLEWTGPPMPSGDLEPKEDAMFGSLRAAVLEHGGTDNGSQHDNLACPTTRDEDQEDGPMQLDHALGCMKPVEECMRLVTHQAHAAVKSLRFDDTVATILDSSVEVSGTEAVELLDKLTELQGSGDVKMVYYPVKSGDKQIVFGRFVNPIVHFSKVGTGEDLTSAKGDAAVKMIGFLRILNSSVQTETAV